MAGRYEILGLLGVGGMGSVYRARDVELDEAVALKIVSPALAATPSMIERFRREVKLARRVTHRNVARVFDIGEHRGERFLTMELVEGESLAARLERDGPLRESELVQLLLQICAGLAAAHAAGVLHRDLKPDNVLLARDGRAVITDFGIASAYVLAGDMRKRTVGVLVGTPDYMAPEQVEAKGELDARTDIYALGAMAFELASGRGPWEDASVLASLASRLVNDPPDLRACSMTSEAFARVVRRCLARWPKDRYPSADEVAAALAAIETSPAVGLGDTMAPPSALRTTDVAVERLATTGDELAPAVAAGFVDLVERNLRGASSLRVVAAGAGAPLVVRVGVHAAVAHVDLAIELVNLHDGVLIAHSRERIVRADLFAAAARVAALVALKLAASYRPTLPAGPKGTLVDLWLRARMEREGARDRAVALFEQAIQLAPDDVWINAGYAAVLVDRFRFDETPVADIVEAEGMAERALLVTDRLSEAWLARGLCRLERGDPLAAVDDLARAAANDPAVRAARARLWIELGRFGRANEELERAIATEPRSSAHRTLRALCLALEGEADGAGAAIDEALALEPTSLHAWMTAARLALWTNDAARVEELRRALARVAFIGRDRVLQMLDPAHEIEAVAIEAAAPRRAATIWQVEAELAALRGDEAATLTYAERAAATAGFIDVAWLSRCPALARARPAPRFTAAVDVASANARIVQERLETRRSP